MKFTKERFLTWALLCTLIAVGLHAYLARQHYALKYGGATGAAVCNVSSTFSCDAVAASTYSSFLGIPMAVWGAVANLMLAFFLLITRLGWTDEREATGRYSMWLASMVALASVIMGSISFTQMTTYCLFCIGAYVLSFLTLFFTWKGTEGFAEFAQDFKALFTTRYWVLICAFLIPGGSYLVNASAMKSSGVAEVYRYMGEIVAAWNNAPVQNFSNERGLIMHKGSGEPKLTIVEFADFRCPACRFAYPTLHAFTEANPGVKLVFKFFPLDGTCNPSPGMGGRGDGISCQIAFVTHCEQKLRGQGWEAHHYFFDHQEKISGLSSPNAVTERYCSDRGGDCEALRTCVESQETRDEIRAMAQEGLDAGIQGTPTIFGNGKLIRNGQMMPVLDAVYKSIR